VVADEAVPPEAVEAEVEVLIVVGEASEVAVIVVGEASAEDEEVQEVAVEADRLLFKFSGMCYLLSHCLFQADMLLVTQVLHMHHQMARLGLSRMLT